MDSNASALIAQPESHRSRSDRHDPDPSDASHLSLTVIDVGAFGGVSREWARLGAIVDVIAFEPSPGECDRLNAVGSPFVRSVRFFPHAVAGDTGSRRLFVTRSPTCCSLAEPNTAAFAVFGTPGSTRANRAAVVREIMVQTVSLDGFCDRNHIRPDFVKLDTQGTEYDILANGFTRGLRDCVGLEIEVEFFELYRGQRLFSDIDSFMRANGFQLMGLKRHRWKMNDGKQCTRAPGGRLAFADALYLNRRALGKCDRNYALKAAALMRRFKLNDVADHIAAHAGIDPAELSGLTDSWDRTAMLPTLPATDHADRGVIVEFDDDYGF